MYYGFWLDVDVNTTTPDKKSIMMYVMCLYQALPHAKVVPLAISNDSTTPMDVSSTPSDHVFISFISDMSGIFSIRLFIRWLLLQENNSLLMNPGDCVDFTAYQTLMEEVLVWLLAAEDHLDSATSIVTELQSVKDQFHKHEVNTFQISISSFNQIH